MNSINLSYMNKHDNPNSDTKKEKIDNMDIWPWRDFWFLMHHLRTTSADLLIFFTTSAKEEAEWKWVCPLIFSPLDFISEIVDHIIVIIISHVPVMNHNLERILQEYQTKC